MALPDIVASNIRLLRTHQKLSQKVLAKRSHLSVSYVSMLERGTRAPTLATLEVIAKALRVAPAYLFQELVTGRSHRSVK